MKKLSLNMNDRAVSPVIGVMLMLVVTVVIAAVVSAFAADTANLEGKTGPNAVLESQMDLDSGLTVKINYTRQTFLGTTYYEQTLEIQQGGSPNPHGIIFTHMGGDAFDLKDLQMSVSTNNLAAMIDYDSIRNQASVDAPELKYSGIGSSSVTAISVSGGYTFDEIKALVDSIDADDYEETYSLDKYFIKIDPETDDDTIIRTGDQFEFVTDDSTAISGPTVDWWAITCVNDGITESFLIERGSGNEWVLSHKPSGAFLASGAFEFPDT